MRRSGLAVVALVAGIAPALVATRDEEHGRDAPEVLEAFVDLARPCGAAVIAVLDDGEQVALATAVDAELLVTKSSEVGETIVLRLPDGERVSARVVARDPNRDLALLHARGLTLEPPRWDTAATAPGRLVTALGAGGAPFSIGLVGVAARHIEGGRGRLGVVLEFVEAAVVARVTPDSPAALAGLLPGDRILAVGDRAVGSREEAVRRIRARGAGERLRLELLRGDSTLELVATLAARPSGGGGRRGRLEGERSGLRAGFPSALQHDCVLAPEQCGGPLVGLDGRMVGLNIARAGRVATYALPTADLLEAVAAMRARAGF